MRTVYRYNVPVDDEEHDVDLTGPLLLVHSREHGIVEFWASADTTTTPVTHRFLVTGTGRYVPDRAVYRGGTVDGTDALLIWHLWEIPVDVDDQTPGPAVTAECICCGAGR